MTLPTLRRRRETTDAQSDAAMIRPHQSRSSIADDRRARRERRRPGRRHAARRRRGQGVDGEGRRDLPGDRRLGATVQVAGQARQGPHRLRARHRGGARGGDDQDRSGRGGPLLSRRPSHERRSLGRRSAPVPQAGGDGPERARPRPAVAQPLQPVGLHHVPRPRGDGHRAVGPRRPRDGTADPPPHRHRARQGARVRQLGAQPDHRAVRRGGEGVPVAGLEGLQDPPAQERQGGHRGLHRGAQGGRDRR